MFSLIGGSPWTGIAQTLPAKDYLATWRLDNDQQTIRAAVLYDDLSRYKDSAAYHHLLAQLEAAIEPPHDPRLQARLLMYKALWTMETEAANSHLWLVPVSDAIKNVYPLNDRQLNAELYALYGELCLRKHNTETALFYNLRSLELQEAIGAAYFPKIGWMYFSVARALYNTQEYEQAKLYARKCLQAISTYPAVSRYNWIFLYDILGGTYSKTGQSDSAVLCFQQIARLINEQDPAKPDTDPHWSRYWLGLVDGYLGRIQLQQGHPDSARILLQHAVKASVAFASQAQPFELRNAAAFLSDLAAVEWMQHNQPVALGYWRQAYQWGIQTGDQQATMQAAAGLAKVFRETSAADSAFYYYDQYHRLQDTLTALLGRSQLNVARARIDYDNTQDSLRDYQDKLATQRRLRNGLVAGTALLIVIAALLYNRSRLRQRHQAQLNEERRLHAEEEAAEARDKLQLLRRHIVEKMELVQAIEQQPLHTDTEMPPQLLAPVILTEADWTSFKTAFTKAWPAFFPALRKAITDISPAQERLSALMYLRLDNTQAAGCLGIGRDSVARSKRRLREKLNLPSEAALEEYIYSLC